MENFADPVLHDERRYEAQCERADRLAAMADELADEMMQSGEEFYPFEPEWLEEVVFERPEQAQMVCSLLAQNEPLMAGELLMAALRDYVRPQAYSRALDMVNE